MRALKLATVAMAVMIVAGTALLAVLIVRRVSPAAPHAAIALHEPPGARIIGIAATPSGLAVALQGGGPDRIVILDPRTLSETARVTLAP